MTKKILLVNPPIYDFSAFDYWLRPYGLLTAAGCLRNTAELYLFDFLDRWAPELGPIDSDCWSRGSFPAEKLPKPTALGDIPRYYRRFGRSRETFRQFIIDNGPFDYAMIQTVLSYWYPGFREAIDDIKTLSPQSKIILGGPYANICSDHALSIGADFVHKGLKFDDLWQYMQISADQSGLPLWEPYKTPSHATIKISDGCPFQCTYCSVASTYGRFAPRAFDRCIREIEYIRKLGFTDVAFYDDALLCRFESCLKPFLEYVIDQDFGLNLHSPNALNARFLTPQVAELMIRAGFKTFYLGFESNDSDWQKDHGDKVLSHELKFAVDNLINAGAEPKNITAYEMIGHPHGNPEMLEESMRFVHSLGIRIMLADFSPIPGTPDGDYCSKFVDLAEPLNHNKTAFPIRIMGNERVNRFKQLCRTLNGQL